MKGWFNNLYTRTFGFEHDGGQTYDALYAKGNEIKIDYFLHSVDLMMRMEYVLPFEKSFNHSMWDYLFNEIRRGRGRDRYRLEDWKHENVGTHLEKYSYSRLSRDKCVNSKNIELALNEDDIELLTQKNKFDLWLYQIAKMIADVDARFYN